MTAAHGFGREEVTPYPDDTGVQMRGPLAMPVDRKTEQAPAQLGTRRDGSTCTLKGTFGEPTGPADPQDTATWEAVEW